MSKTKIPFADYSWSPVVGCTPIASGCKNCWAKRLHTQRYDAYYQDKQIPCQYAVPFSRVQLLNYRLDDPLHWRKPRVIFVNSISDTFHKDVDWAFIDKIHAVMALCPQHTFLLCTKRCERALKYYNDKTYGGNVRAAVVETNAKHISTSKHRKAFPWLDENCGARLIWPQHNVHLYFSVSSQAEVDKALPILMEIPAAVRGLSLEPCIAPISLYGWVNRIIVGCESGSNRRPCEWKWIRDIVKQCRDADAKLYVKQMEIDGKVTSDISKFPKDLQVRQF